MTRPLISTAQIRRLQKLNEKAMPDEVTILIPAAASPDGYGQQDQGFTDGPTVKCRFRATTQRADSKQGERTANRELFLFLVPVATEIGRTYRLRRKGIEYEIVGEPTDSSHQLSKLVLAKRI